MQHSSSFRHLPSCDNRSELYPFIISFNYSAAKVQNVFRFASGNGEKLKEKGRKKPRYGICIRAIIINSNLEYLRIHKPNRICERVRAADCDRELVS